MKFVKSVSFMFYLVKSSTTSDVFTRILSR